MIDESIIYIRLFPLYEFRCFCPEPLNLFPGAGLVFNECLLVLFLKFPQFFPGVPLTPIMSTGLRVLARFTFAGLILTVGYFGDGGKPVILIFRIDDGPLWRLG